MFTPRTNSATVTTPLPSQSPTHPKLGAACITHIITPQATSDLGQFVLNKSLAITKRNPDTGDSLCR